MRKVVMASSVHHSRVVNLFLLAGSLVSGRPMITEKLFACEDKVE